MDNAKDGKLPAMLTLAAMVAATSLDPLLIAPADDTALRTELDATPAPSLTQESFDLWKRKEKRLNDTIAAKQAYHDATMEEIRSRFATLEREALAIPGYPMGAYKAIRDFREFLALR